VLVIRLGTGRAASPELKSEVVLVVRWSHLGPTDPANLVSLCRFHHHRHHEGAFRIVADSDSASPRRDGFRFETSEGRLIGVRLASPVDHDECCTRWLGERDCPDTARISPRPPAAGSGGERFDLDHTIVVLAGNRINVAIRRGAEQPSGP
jgi:hypothetical protein